MLDENDWQRLTRYITGEGTDAERQETERWIAAAPARAALVDRLRAGWERAAEPAEPFDVDRAWGEVVRRKTVRSAPEPGRRAVAPGFSRPLFAEIDRARGRRRWAVAAAAAVVTLALAGTVRRAISPSPRPGTAAEVGTTRTVTTRPGQMADVYLSDGTHVRLGAASTIRFPAAFGARRDVRLDGEGYFDVAHDPGRVFAVHTARAVARDIGTRFDVRAYSDGPSTEVVVAEGAVALKPRAAARAGVPPDSVVLTRSDLGRVDAAGVLTVTRQVSVDDYLGWMRGRLVFTDAPLRDVLPRLSRWYGVRMTVGDSVLADARLTATLDLNAEALSDALRRLASLLDARVERRGRQGELVVLYVNPRAR